MFVTRVDDQDIRVTDLYSTLQFTLYECSMARRLVATSDLSLLHYSLQWSLDALCMCYLFAPVGKYQKYYLYYLLGGKPLVQKKNFPLLV